MVAALVIFFVQQAYFRKNEEAQRAVALANIASDTLRREATTLVDSFNTYVEGTLALQEAKSIAPTAPSTREKASGLQESYHKVKSSMVIIEAVAGAALPHRSEFEADLDAVNKYVVVIGTDEDVTGPLSALLNSYAALVVDVQQATRSAVRKEYSLGLEG